MNKRLFKYFFVLFIVFAFTHAQAFTISGRIIWTDNHNVGVKSVVVNLSGADTQSTTTNDRGVFTFTTSLTGDFTITPSYNVSVLNGVTSDDAPMITNHVTGSSLFADSYKLIASDVNNTTTVSASDVSTVTQAISGSPIALNTMTTTGSWKFVPESYSGFPYPPTNPNNISGYPTTIALTGVSSNSTSNNFIAVKIGDVNGTADTGPATIDSVTTTTVSGAYGLGQVIPITVNFSEPVTSTGDVTVTIETGTTDRTCAFTITNSSSGTCNYTITAGDISSDLAISSVSGTITDVTGNPTTDLVIYSNINDTKDIIIDGVIPSIAQSSGVSPYTNDTTPDFAFTTSEVGTITYGGSCSSGTTVAVLGANVITLNTLVAGTYSNCTITITDGSGNPSAALSLGTFVVDLTAPVLTSDENIPTPSRDSTPGYFFTTDEAGTITYGGSCSSGTTVAVLGANVIALNALNPGTYSNCTITLTDSAGNTSNTISLPTFTIIANSVVPVWLLSQPTTVSTNSGCADNSLFDAYTGKTCSNATIQANQETQTLEVCKILPAEPFLIKRGTIHSSVKLLQEILNTRGYAVSLFGLGSKNNETNFYGSKTISVILKFQKEKKIRVDGIVGPETRGTINEYCNK